MLQHKLNQHLASSFQTKTNAHASTSSHIAIPYSRTYDETNLLRCLRRAIPHQELSQPEQLTPLFAMNHTATGVASSTSTSSAACDEPYCNERRVNRKTLPHQQTLPPTARTVMRHYASSVPTYPQDDSSPHTTRTHRHDWILQILSRNRIC